jgi:hypothetical protein
MRLLERTEGIKPKLKLTTSSSWNWKTRRYATVIKANRMEGTKREIIKHPLDSNAISLEMATLVYCIPEDEINQEKNRRHPPCWNGLFHSP